MYQGGLFLLEFFMRMYLQLLVALILAILMMVVGEATCFSVCTIGTNLYSHVFIL